MNSHHPKDNHAYITNAGDFYDIFMNAMDLEKIESLFKALPNVKKIHDHTHEIFGYDFPLHNDNCNGYVYTKSTHKDHWDGQKSGLEAIVHFKKFIEIANKNNVEINYYYKNQNNVLTADDVIALDSAENMLLGEAIPNYIE
jgi:hypothetical protein